MFVKTNENQSIITKKFTPIFLEKDTTDCCDLNETRADIKDCLSDIIGVISKLIKVTFRKSPGNINSWVELNYVICIGEVDNSSFFLAGSGFTSKIQS